MGLAQEFKSHLGPCPRVFGPCHDFLGLKFVVKALPPKEAHHFQKIQSSLNQETLGSIHHVRITIMKNENTKKSSNNQNQNNALKLQCTHIKNFNTNNCTSKYNHSKQ